MVDEKMREAISIIVPIYCEEQNIIPLYNRLESVISSFPEIDWEYLFVDDGSTDSSVTLLKRLTRLNNKVKVLCFSRNFGKEAALSAGVNHAKTDAVICIDADLQHPPELIFQFVNEWRSGADIVTSIRVTSESKPFFRRIGSSVYYWLMKRISSLDMEVQSTDFRLLDRKVVDEFRRITERGRLFRGIIDWMGFRRSYIKFHASKRNDGIAGYSYGKLWNLALSSITKFSLFPLLLTGYLGVLITLISIFLLGWMISNYLFVSSQAFTPLAVVVVINTFLIGVVLMAIGLVSLYIGSIHTEAINRPLYIIREWVNFSETTT
jgi:glycosyltransferase involved in cell wall biosynthesis